MTRRASILLGLVLAMGLAAPARANNTYQELNILDCGTVANSNGSWQFGEFAWLEYLVETQGRINLCGQWIVAVEASVAGVANSGMKSGAQFLTATVRRHVPVPNYGWWTTQGKHWATTSFWPGLTWNGGTSSQAEVKPPRRDREYECYLLGGEWDGYQCYIPNCPLIVDTQRNGYKLTSVEDGVLFDLDADGSPERVAWTAEGSDEAFLVMDRNGNGQIDDGTELFGDRTPAYPDGSRITTANGFEALSFLESPAYGGSYGELGGTIDARDPAFARLMLWRDANHNGVSEPEELQTLEASGLLGIRTDYKTSARKDRYGNEFRQRAKGVWAEGEGFIYDVWLQRR